MKKIAIIGGGLAGLSTAYAAANTQEPVSITLFEKGADSSYQAGNDDSHRASLGGSAARVVRLSGAGEGVGEWNVRQTKAMIDVLQKQVDTNPAFAALAGTQLFHPEASVLVAASAEDKSYVKTRDSLKRSGAAYSEVSGAELKSRYPHVYETVADNAVAVIEEPFSQSNAKGVCGVMDAAAVMQALKIHLQQKGVAIRSGEEVTAVNDVPAGAQVTAGEVTETFDRAVLATGQWLSQSPNAKKAGIQTRLDRVVVMDIDFKAMGLETKGVPFSKGGNPEGAAGAFYTHSPDSAEGHVKFLPAVATKSVQTLSGLQAPITDAEKEDALDAAAKRFALDKETLRANTKFSSCAYTCPRVEEKVLVAPISEHVSVIGLDSSGFARTAAGHGLIAAHQALGLQEPYAGANQAFGLEGHKELVSRLPVIEDPAKTAPHKCHGCPKAGTCDKSKGGIA